MSGEAALGRAVLELSTDGKQLDAGLADVPKKVKKTAEAATDAGKEFKKLNDLLGQFGVGLSIGAVVAFGKSVLDLADNIVKVHDKTGLTTDDVQRLQYIAEQSGNSIDDLSGAISKLQVRLADGKAKAGIEALGLNFKKIRDEAPVDAFGDIAEAIGKIENPTLRAQRAVEVFGKAGTEILPTLVANFKELGKAAPVMSEETVLALDAAGDAINRFGSTIKVWAAESYNYARGFFDKLVAEAYKMVQRLYENAAGLAALAAKLPGASKLGIDQKFVDGLKESAVWYGNVAKGMETTTTAATKNKPAMAALPPIHDKISESAKKAAEALATLTEKLSGVDTAKQVALLDAALRSLEKTGALTGPQMKAIGEAAQKLREEGALLTPRLAELARVQDLVAIATKNAATAAKEQDDAFKRFNTGAGIYLSNLPTAIFQTRSFAGAIVQVSAAAATFQGNLANIKFPGPSFWERAFGSPKDFGANFSASILAAIQGGGSVVNAAGGMVGKQLGSTIAGSLSKSLLKEGAGMLSQALGGMLNAVLPGVGALLGPLLSKVWSGIKSIFGNGSAGRDLVVQFADSLGGFDVLQKKLEALGEAGAALWIKLTQGVGKNDTKAAQAAIDDVTKALDAQASQQGEATQATEEAALATIETATQASAALDALGPKIETNKEQWGGWSEDVTGDIDRVAAALRSITMPSPSPRPAGFVEGDAPYGPTEYTPVPMAGGGFGRVTRPTLFYSRGDEDYAFSGEGRSFGLNALAQRPIVIEHTTKLDSRVVARETLRHTPNELARVGIRS